ncbi:MAG: hypothetical protein QW407_06975 [Thermofilaceae archaeon]
MKPEPQNPRWGRGEKGAARQGAFGPTLSGGIRALPGETRRGAATPKAPSKNFGDGGWGYRVFRVEANAEKRKDLERFYRRLVSRDPSLPKSAFRYLESWEEEKAAVLEMREQAGKRTPPKRDPAFYLNVKFVKDGKRVHGSEGAPAVVDLGRGELRIPCAGIRIPLKPSLLQALEEDLRLRVQPEFALQLTCRGRLRLIAFRSPPRWWLYREESDDFGVVHLRPPVRVVGLDLNSVFGLTVVVFDITDGNRVRVPKSPMRWQPPNDTLFLTMASVLRKIARGLPPTPPRNATEEERQLWQWALERVKELEKKAGALTTERADRLRRQLERSARIARKRWARKVVHVLRQLIRETGGRAIVAIDVPHPESLRNSPLQKTYLRVTKVIKNLCAYEGVRFLKVRTSGRMCPLCNRWCEEVEHRYYRCSHCSVVVDRDYGASFRAGLTALPPALADTLRGWLKAHPKALARNYGNKPSRRPQRGQPQSSAAPSKSPASRDPYRAGSTRSGALQGARARDEGESSREAHRRRCAERRE